MLGELLLESVSPCHKADSIIVRSREGGFVTQNCVVCGKSRPLSRKEVPDLPCRRCGGKTSQVTNRYKNYAYSCSTCADAFELAALVPWYAEIFGDRGRGYALDTD
jgi:ssDNA-binding Zn-finger/Zn-ribbon topoisomerase 1